MDISPISSSQATKAKAKGTPVVNIHPSQAAALKEEEEDTLSSKAVVARLPATTTKLPVAKASRAAADTASNLAAGKATISNRGKVAIVKVNNPAIRATDSSLATLDMVSKPEEARDTDRAEADSPPEAVTLIITRLTPNVSARAQIQRSDSVPEAVPQSIPSRQLKRLRRILKMMRTTRQCTRRHFITPVR